MWEAAPPEPGPAVLPRWDPAVPLTGPEAQRSYTEPLRQEEPRLPYAPVCGSRTFQTSRARMCVCRGVTATEPLLNSPAGWWGLCPVSLSKPLGRPEQGQSDGPVAAGPHVQFLLDGSSTRSRPGPTRC